MDSLTDYTPKYTSLLNRILNQAGGIRQPDSFILPHRRQNAVWECLWVHFFIRYLPPASSTTRRLKFSG